MVRRSDNHQETNKQFQNTKLQHNGPSLETSWAETQVTHMGTASSQASGLQHDDHVITQELDVQHLRSNQVETNTTETKAVPLASESPEVRHRYHHTHASQQEQQSALTRVNDDYYLGPTLISTIKFSQLDEKKSKAFSKLSELQTCITSTQNTKALNEAMRSIYAMQCVESAKSLTTSN